MSSSNNDKSDNNEAISPDIEELIARAKKRFIFSISLFLIGITAVIFVVIMRAGEKEKSVEQNYTAGTIVAPSGAEILSAVPSEGMIAITYSLNGKVKLRLINGSTGAIIRDIDFVTE
jgi:uncharacterized integral membrane protein